MDTSITSSPVISPSQLCARIGRADAPLLLDVRRAPVFAASPFLLAGAYWCAPEAVSDFVTAHAPREVVVYCAYGHALSEQAAATLCAAGWDARKLAGGIEGGEDGVDGPGDLVAWRAAPLPRLRKRAELGVVGLQPSRWITRARPKIDRVACPWLIRRFIDPRASFFYVPTDQVFVQAERLGAVAFDIPGAPVSHEGERCSFDTLLKIFELQDPALTLLARIVRGADTDRLDLAPQSAGLLALSLGLSRLHADDQAMLTAAMPVYDALYAWCCGAQDEPHSWKPETMVDTARR